jgi:diguanylate cyclase (GGDEF)-like protein
MEIRYYLQMIRRGWWIILLTVFIALDVALITGFVTTPIYSATTQFVLSPNPNLISSGPELVSSMDTLDKRSIVNTYAQFISSDRIYNDTLTQVNIPVQDLLQYKRTAVVVPNSNIIELRIEGPDPKTCASLANIIGQRAVEYLKQIYPAYSATILDAAIVPIEPIRPIPLRDAGLAIVIGLVVGAGLAILRESIQMTIDSYSQRLKIDRESTVYNRSYILNQLEQELSSSTNEEISFGLVRLEGIRGLSELVPQNLMQELLRQVANTLRKELRGNDIIGRWDDITFAILLPTTPAVAANRTLKRICTPIAQPLSLKHYDEEINLQPRLSIITSKEDETITEMIQRGENGLELTQRLTSKDDSE